MTVIYLFGKFSDQDIDWIIGAGARENVSEGQILINEGVSVKSFYITLSGRLRVTSKQKLIASIGPGEAVGEISFLDGRPPAATVTAAEDCVVVSFSMKRLRTKLRLDPGFGSRFFHALSAMLALRIRRAARLVAMSGSTLDDEAVEAGPSPPPLLEDTSLTDKLVDSRTHESVPAGVALISEGQHNERFYITISGRFRVTLRQGLIASIGPGEVVGELSFLDGLPQVTTVTASEDCVVAPFSMSELRAALGTDDSFASRFYHGLSIMLADRIRRCGRLLATAGDDFDDDTVDGGLLSPSLLEETTLASTRFDELRRNFLNS